MITGGGVASQEQVGTVVSAAQTGQITPGASATVMTGTGIFAGSTTTVDAASTRDVNALGRYYQSDTSAISGNNAGNSCGDAAFRMDQKCVGIWNGGVSSIASIRLFNGLIGAIGINFANCVDADTLGSPGMGFQFSTPRGDTNFKFVTYNGTTQTTVDTGVAAQANTLYSFQINIDSATSVRWAIYSSAGLLLASGTATLTLPTSTQKFVIASAIETETTAVKSILNYSFAGIGLGYIR